MEDELIEDEGAELCSNCGSQMEQVDGELICPHCDTEIDYFGDEEAEMENHENKGDEDEEESDLY